MFENPSYRMVAYLALEQVWIFAGEAKDSFYEDEGADLMLMQAWGMLTSDERKFLRSREGTIRAKNPTAIYVYGRKIVGA